jgi:hypothetical protein
MVLMSRCSRFSNTPRDDRAIALLDMALSFCRIRNSQTRADPRLFDELLDWMLPTRAR